MTDDIASRVLSLQITEEKDAIVNLISLETSDNNLNLELALVGKVITIRNFNFEALMRTLNQIREISSAALFRPIENGLFAIQFTCGRDKEKVMHGRTWTFDKNLVMLQEINDSTQPSNIQLNRCPFWARLYNLPMGCRTEGHIRRVGGCLWAMLWR